MKLQTLSKEKIIEKYLQLEKEIDKLKKEKEALEKELRKYKNPNTPPSANQHLKPAASKIIEVCHLKFLARDNQTPLQGRFGINLMVLVIFLKFIVRGVLRKTSSFLEASFALKLAPTSVHD